MGNFKKFLAVLSTAAVVSAVALPSVTFALGDIEGHWGKGFIEFGVEQGYFDGSKDMFYPEETMNRAQAAKVLDMACGVEGDEANKKTFPDVNEGDWFYEPVMDMASVGIINGFGDGTFGPEKNVTRAQYAKMAVLACGIEVMEDAQSIFDDIAEDAWERKYVMTAYANSMLDGYGNGMFGSNDEITRAQSAKITSIALDPQPREIPAPGETPGETPMPEGGELMVSLSDNSPEGDIIPGLASGVTLAAYDFTAGDMDVVLNTVKLELGGQFTDDVVTQVALVDMMGNRVSKSKSVSGSEDEATLNLLDGGVMIDAGETVTLNAVATLGSTASHEGQTFYFMVPDADSVLSSADEVTGSFPVKGDTFVVGAVDAGQLLINGDGMPSDVQVGERDAEIARFQLENNDNDSDIEFWGITFKQEGTVDESDELGNFKLYIEGEMVAETAMAVDNYVSFKLDEGLVIPESQEVDGHITSDILGGPGDNIFFQVDETLDVVAVDLDYGTGAQIVIESPTATFNVDNDGSTAAKRVDIEAGEITVVAIDAENTDIRQDKDDVLLGTARVTVNAGEEIELQKFEITIENVDSGRDTDSQIVDILSNVEVYDGRSSYDLDVAYSGDGYTGTFTDDSIDILLANGSTTDLVITADINNVDEDDADLNMDNVELEVKISNIGGATKAASGMYFEETDEDTAVTDVTPSSVTFKTLEGTESSATARVITQSATKTAVIGTKEVEAMKFEVEATDASDIFIDRVSVTGTVTDTASEASYAITITGNDLVGAEDPAAANLTLGGIDISVDITVGADNNTVASIIATAINANANFTATAAANVVTYNWAVGCEAATCALYDAAALKAAVDAADLVDDDIAFTQTEVTAPQNDGADTELDNTRISKMSLYHTSVSPENMLDSMSGSSLSSGVAIFDDFDMEDGEVMVPADGEVTFIVTTDVVDDENQNNDSFILSLAAGAFNAEDDDNDDVTVGGLAFNSARTVNIKGTGNLTVVVDNTDSATDQDKYVLGGTTSDYVASYELTALNEAVVMKDATFTAANLNTYVSMMHLYSEDSDTPFASKTVTDGTVEFTGIDYKVEEGSENIYVKVEAHRIGKDQAGVQQDDETANITMTMTVTDADGYDSNKTVTPTYDDTNSTLASNIFSIIPVQVSEVAFVESQGGRTVNTSLNEGENTLAIVKVVNADHDNTNATDGSALETVLRYMKLDQSNFSETVIRDVTIERISGADGKQNVPLSVTDDADTTFVETYSTDTVDVDGGEVTIDSKVTGDTGITVAVTDGNGVVNGCGAVDLSAYPAVTVECDITGAATRAQLETVLEATNYFDVTVNTPGAIGAAVAATATALAGGDGIVIDMNTLFTSDQLLDAGETAYYVIEATVDKRGSGDNDDYVELSFETLNNANLVFSSDDTDATNWAELIDLRLEDQSLDGVQINEQS